MINRFYLVTTQLFRCSPGQVSEREVEFSAISTQYYSTLEEATNWAKWSLDPGAGSGELEVTQLTGPIGPAVLSQLAKVDGPLANVPCGRYKITGKIADIQFVAYTQVTYNQLICQEQCQLKASL